MLICSASLALCNLEKEKKNTYIHKNFNLRYAGAWRQHGVGRTQLWLLPGYPRQTSCLSCGELPQCLPCGEAGGSADGTVLVVFHTEHGLGMAAVMHGMILCRASVVELLHP